MSLETSKNNYNIARNLYQRISDSFSDIEGGDVNDFTITQTIDDIKRLKTKLRGINLSDFDGKYDKDTVLMTERNVEKFKEMAHYIEKVLGGIVFYDDLLASLPKYINTVDTKDMTDEEAIKKITGHMTHQNNFEFYVNDIKNIIRGKMSMPMFNKIYDAIISKSPKEKTIVRNKHIEQPPEMWDTVKKKEWIKRQSQRKKDILQDKRNTSVSTDAPKETNKGRKSFITLPMGNTLEYDFKIKNKDGIITYFKNDKKIYSFQNESFLSFKEYEELL